ncbi:MAG: hypothetical protein FWG16_07115 [Micrococcales bacterium]|nr:hypothetical protein [Micrococcales bacterium]
MALPVVGVEPVGGVEDRFDGTGVFGFDVPVFEQGDLGEKGVVDLGEC